MCKISEGYIYICRNGRILSPIYENNDVNKRIIGKQIVNDLCDIIWELIYRNLCNLKKLLMHKMYFLHASF